MKNLILMLGLVVSLLLLNGCQSAENTADTFDWRAATDFPASYSGTLPCADCPGIDYRLNLFADQSFFLQTEYRDRKPGRYFQMGRWQLHDGDTLSLLSDQQNHRFAISENNLLLLNQQGQQIISDLNYQLQRNTQFRAVLPQLPMRGLYRSIADSTVFTECLSGQSWPVAQMADNTLLEQRYLEMRSNPEQSLLVSLNGEIILGKQADSEQKSRLLKVNKFTGIWPGETCGQPGYKENLLNTYWKLTRLQNQPVLVRDGQREASLTLSKDEKNRVSGSDGCNQIMGSYQLKDNKLKFSQLASTMMACPQGMDTSQRFHTILEQVHFWRIKAQYLELLDKDSQQLARFQAVHL